MTALDERDVVSLHAPSGELTFRFPDDEPPDVVEYRGDRYGVNAIAEPGVARAYPLSPEPEPPAAIALTVDDLAASDVEARLAALEQRVDEIDPPK